MIWMSITKFLLVIFVSVGLTTQIKEGKIKI